MAYGLPVGVMKCLSFDDANVTHGLLLVLEKFKFFKDVTVDQIHTIKIGSIHRVTIWEDLNVNTKSRK